MTLILLTLLSQLPTPVYATTAPMTFYVAADGGSDSNDCLAADRACATIQGALARSPQQLRHRVEVAVAPGNYGGFTVQGFSAFADPTAASGGLLIEGTMETSVLDGGLTSGGVTSATQGSGATFGTLTTDAGWGTNALRGRLLVLTGGTGAGQTRIVSSNTNETATVVGSWVTTPTTSTTWELRDPATHITTAISGPSYPEGVGASNAGQVIFANNSLGNHNGGYGQVSVLLEYISFEANAPSIAIYDDSAVGLYDAKSLNTNAVHFQTRQGNLVLSTVYSYSSSTTAGTHVATGPQGGGATVQYSLLHGGSTGVMNSAGYVYVPNTEVLDANAYGIFSRPNLNGVTLVQNARLDCASSSGVGVQQGLGLSSPMMFSVTGGGVIAQAIDVHDCGWFARAIGPGYITFPSGLGSSTGAPASVGLEARSGALIIFDPSIVGWTQPATEASLDNGGNTTTLAGIAASSCLTGGTFGSRVCKP